jgi:2-amino-4-hydroxy-6-hydroxymethyldihydropteridine diphosphokinase
MVSSIFLGLGSNKGDRKNYILKAINKIQQSAESRIEKVSSLYETTPYGTVDQENYYNAVVEITSEFELSQLFEFVKLLEKKLGRTQCNLKWAPREIDIDILFYNKLIYSDNKLTVPHKEILLRDFVLVPLIEIAGYFVHPVINKKLSEVDLAGIETHILRKIDFPTNNMV